MTQVQDAREMLVAQLIGSVRVGQLGAGPKSHGNHERTNTQDRAGNNQRHPPPIPSSAPDTISDAEPRPWDDHATHTKQIKAIDPTLSSVLTFMEPVAGVSGAEATTTRLTLSVPADNATLNLGVAANDPTRHVMRRIFHKGLTGRSDTHIHFRVQGSDDAPASLISLGSSPERLKIGARTFDESWTGYTMVTAGRAWHESAGHHVVVSSDEDVVVRSAGWGKSAVLQADKGKVGIAGQQEVVVGSSGNVHIAAKTEGPLEVRKYGEVYDAEVGKWVHSHWLVMTSRWLQVAKSVGEVIGTFAALRTSPQSGKASWEKKTLKAAAVSIGADILGLIGDGVTALSSAPTTGVVSITGSDGITIGSERSTAIFGKLTTSIAGGIGASVMGNVIASVHGVLGTTIASGGATTVRSLKDVEVRADGGELLAHARKNVTLACEAGPLVLGGRKSAQLNSEGPVRVSSGKSAYVGGDNMALFLGAGEVRLGAATASDQYDKREGDSDLPYFEIDKSRVVLHSGLNSSSISSVEVNSGGIVELRGNGLSAKIAKYIELNSDKILLD